MSLELITKKVLSYCEIPEDIDKRWLDDCSPNCYVSFSIANKVEDRDELENWIIENYPELENEQFLIEIDY